MPATKVEKELWPDIQLPSQKARKLPGESAGATQEAKPSVPETLPTPPKPEESLAPPKPAPAAPPAAADEIAPAKKPSPKPQRLPDTMAPLTEVPEQGPISPPSEKPAPKPTATKVMPKAPADDEPAAPSKRSSGGTKREDGKFLPGIGTNRAGDRLDRLMVDDTPKPIAKPTVTAAPEPPALWSDSMPSERPNLLRQASYQPAQMGTVSDVRLTVHNDTSSDSRLGQASVASPREGNPFYNPLR